MTLKELGEILYGLPANMTEFLQNDLGLPGSTKHVIVTPAEGGGYVVEPAGNKNSMLGMWPQVRIGPTVALSERVDGYDLLRECAIKSITGLVSIIGYGLDKVKILYEGLPEPVKRIGSKMGRLLLIAALLGLPACRASTPQHPTSTPSPTTPSLQAPTKASTHTPTPTVTPAPTATYTPAPTPTPTITPTPTPYPGKFGMIGYDRMPRPQDFDSDGIITNSDILEHLVHLGYIPPEYVDVRITPKDIEILGYRAILYELDDSEWGPIFVPTSDDGKSGFWIIGAAGGPLFATPTPVGPVVLWEDDFEDIDEWRGPNNDKSVNVCDNSFPKNPSIDYGVEKVVDPTSPSDDDNVVQIISNKTKRGGFYGNMNIFRPVPFVDGKGYLFYGYFRKGPEGQPQAITVSIELIRDYTEHYAEILWVLNPYAKDDPSGANYGWAITRGEGGKVIPLINIGDDYQWHYFEIQTRYDTRKGIYLMERIKIDDHEFPLNIPLGTFPKWWKSSFGVALQVANMYTNCDPNIITVGTAMFDKVGMKRLP